MQNIYEVESANKRKSVFITLLFAFFVASTLYIFSQAFGAYTGYTPGGIGYVGIALIISGLMSVAGYYYSDKIVLTISGAKPARREEYFDFYTVAENLSVATGLPKPKLYVINDSAPNAFATGRSPRHAAVCATTGLLEKLNRTELEGVIAHELTHVKNYDTRLMAVVSIMVGTIALMGDWFLRMQWYGGRKSGDNDNKNAAIFIILGLVFAILSPIAANLIKLAISRRREFMADAGSVAITRQPSGLISALKKISGDTEALEAANKATAHMYIVNPFKGKRDHRAVTHFANLFNTHPPIEERLAALSKML